LCCEALYVNPSKSASALLGSKRLRQSTKANQSRLAHSRQGCASPTPPALMELRHSLRPGLTRPARSFEAPEALAERGNFGERGFEHI